MTKNCIILEIRPRSEQVVFAARNSGLVAAQLFTEAEAIREVERLRPTWPTFRFQIVVLRPTELTEFDRTD